MAQIGDTITYTYSDGKSVAEDVSNVGEVFVEYCDGTGGATSAQTIGGAGGRVENATIDVSNESTIYIWVGTYIFPSDDSAKTGRYAETNAVHGSTEIALVDTAEEDSDNEPFLVGSGAGGGGGDGGAFGGDGGSAGARGGNGGEGAGAGVDGISDTSTPPPAGGDGGDAISGIGGDGDGAIDDQNRGLVSGGTTIKGGGSPADTAGEVKLSFQAGLSPPDPPSNLTAEVQ